MTTMRRLLEAWGGSDIAHFLMDAVQTAIDEGDHGGVPGLSEEELLKHVVGGRITARPPTRIG